jgi:PKHD-type hydroxylase
MKRMFYNYTEGVEIEIVDSLVSVYSALTSNDVEHKVASIRTSTTTFLDKSQHQDIFHLIHSLALQANNDAYGFHIDDIEACQFGLYEESDKGHYTWHIDFKGFDETRDKQMRKISVVIQLSEPTEYEGGELQLKYSNYSEQQKSDMLKKGSVITFPSFVEHRVTPVTKGKRLSLIGCAVGDAWK